MKMKLLCVGIVLLGVSYLAGADTFGTGANQFTIDFVTISGDASSGNGTNISQFPSYNYPPMTFTDVLGPFRIGVYEITNDQWNKFVAMHGNPTVSPSNAYDKSPYWTGANVPTNNVSWYEAAQFVNWLNIEAGKTAAYKFTGTPGTSDYTFDVWDVTEAWGGTNLYRHKDAFYFLPTEDEWVKAAYWNGETLQMYAIASNSDLISGIPDPTKWNYRPSLGSQPWEVGNGAKEVNDTFDMMGNVWEWMESPQDKMDYAFDSIRSNRGGSYPLDYLTLRMTWRTASSPGAEASHIGFRVASVPEPASLGLLFLGGVLIRSKRFR